MSPLPTINKKRLGKPKTAHVEFKPPKSLENPTGKKLLSSICLGGEQKGKQRQEKHQNQPSSSEEKMSAKEEQSRLDQSSTGHMKQQDPSEESKEKSHKPDVIFRVEREAAK